MISHDRLSRVLDEVGVALRGGVTLPDDGLLLIRVRDDGSKVTVGRRSAVRAQLVYDKTIDARSASFLTNVAPRGYAWAVIDWGDEVSTLLHSVETAKGAA
jgi:hypothetical protein